MTLYISHYSALDFWLDGRHDAGCGPRVSFEGSEMTVGSLRVARPEDSFMRIHSSDSACGVGVNPALEKIGLCANELELLVDERAKRSGHPGIVPRLCLASLPPNSFVGIGEGLAVSSPELCFVQLAAILPLSTLIELGFLLCAPYALGNPVTRKAGKRVPLCSLEGLREYVASMSGQRGAKKARRALQFVCGNSRSHMETALTMSLTLPRGLNGRALPQPILNHPIEIEGANRKYTQRNKIIADLYWPEFKLDVEYESDEDHLNSRQRTLDANRLVVADKLGVKVIEVTRLQMKRMQEFRVVELAIREAMGLRARRPEPEYDLACQRFRDELMWPFHSRLKEWRRRASPDGNWQTEFDDIA